MNQMLTMILSALLLSSCHKEDSHIQVELPTGSGMSIRMVVGDTAFSVSLYNNATTADFVAMLPLTLHMNDFNNNEKVCSLPQSLTTAASYPGTIHTGDIMLYGSSSLVLFYETFATSYSYTQIGRVDHVAGLKAALAEADVTIRFELE